VAKNSISKLQKLSINWRKLYLALYFWSMPLHAWLITGAGVRKAYKELKFSEFNSSSELSVLQDRKLRELVCYAYENSDFYKSRFDSAGLTPKDIQTTEDLSKIPMLSKSDVRENLHRGLISKIIDEKEMLKITTSGSTGEPFTIFADRTQLEFRFATTMRAAEWAGWRIGDKQARLWHQTLGMTKIQAVRERLDAILLRRLFIPAFEIDPISIGRIIQKLNRYKPVLLDGYAESLNLLASYIAQTGDKIDFAPKGVMSSAQALPDATRKQIEESFKTKVYDKYGSREFSGIAYECASHSGHHVMEESYIVELLVDDRPAKTGEIGEIVITDLLNRAVPMIRYRIGDLATALDNSKNCECGRSHKRIGQIQGRTQAIVHCSNGTWLPGTFFAHFFKGYESCIRFFQIYQVQKGEFELRVVRGTDFTQSEFEVLLKDLRQYVGDTHIEVIQVHEIPMVRTGKRSPVISLISEDFQRKE
jgi:phenylacetate-CoA ligase